MALGPVLLFLLLSLAAGVSSQTNGDRAPPPPPPPPRGCGAGVAPAYRALCDLEAAWGVALEAAACGGALAALALALALLARRRSVRHPGRRCGLPPLLLTLGAVFALFALSPAFLAGGRSPGVCVARRALWAPLHALCFAGLLAQGVRLRRLAAGGGGGGPPTTPSGGALAASAAALAAVQAVVSGEWVLLTVAREGHAACSYPRLDFALVCCYALALLLAAMGVALAVVVCGGGAAAAGGGEGEGGRGEKRGWRSNGVWLFLACLASALLWVGWLGFYLYGDPALKAGPRGGGGRGRGGWRARPPDGDEPALAVALVAQGWVLLLFHAIPEAHLCLRRAPQAAAAAPHDYFGGGPDPPPPPPRRFADETQPRPVRQFAAENQAFSIEEHGAALRGGAYHNGHGGIRPGIPFRGHVYQPTEMALVMNGGTMPTAPVNYTGRQLW